MENAEARYGTYYYTTGKMEGFGDLERENLEGYEKQFDGPGMPKTTVTIDQIVNGEVVVPGPNQAHFDNMNA